MGSIPGSGRYPWRREWQPTPVFLPREVHGQRSLVGYNLWGCKESDMTEHLTSTERERCLVKVQTVPLHSFWRFHPIWQVLTLCCVSSLPCLQPPAFLLLSWYSELELHGDVQLPGHRLSLPTISTCLPCLERWDWHWNFSHFFQSLFSRVGRPLEELILCPSVGQETYSCSSLGTKKSVLGQTITQVHHSPVLGHLSFPICKKGSIVVLTFQ